MQKIRFIKSNSEYNVELKLCNNRVICTFSSEEDAKSAPIEEGFVEINEHNGIEQGNYEKYIYIYKQESDKVVILTTNENDIYIENTNDNNDIDDQEQHELTEEEIAERERQEKILDLNNQIKALKEQLSNTDYIFVKSYEASIVGVTIDEYDYTVIHEERQNLRQQINELEDEVNKILNN